MPTVLRVTKLSLLNPSPKALLQREKKGRGGPWWKALPRVSGKTTTTKRIHLRPAAARPLAASRVSAQHPLTKIVLLALLARPCRRAALTEPQAGCSPAGCCRRRGFFLPASTSHFKSLGLTTTRPGLRLSNGCLTASLQARDWRPRALPQPVTNRLLGSRYRPPRLRLRVPAALHSLRRQASGRRRTSCTFKATGCVPSFPRVGIEAPWPPWLLEHTGNVEQFGPFAPLPDALYAHLPPTHSILTEHWNGVSLSRVLGGSPRATCVWGGSLKETLRFVPSYTLRRSLWTGFGLTVSLLFTGKKPPCILAEASHGTKPGTVLKTGMANPVCLSSVLGSCENWRRLW